MAADPQRAITFIEQHGTQGERAGLRTMLTYTPRSAESASAILADQRADGGWVAFWAEGYSSLDATCFRLAQAEQAGVPFADAPMRHAARFLRERQRPDPDGAWEEETLVANLAPPWVRPGDPAARRYLTANCAFWCAILGVRDAAERGAAALERESDAPTFAQTLWLSAGLAYLLGRPTAADRPLAELAARLDDLPANSLTWLLTTLLLAGVATTHPLVRDAAMRLEDMQRADGSWPSDEGEERVVHVTLEALRALRLCGRL